MQSEEVGMASNHVSICRSWPNLNDERDADKIWHSYLEAQEKIFSEIENTTLDPNSKQQRKLEAMETYVHQLKEQNEVLLKTAVELEREARMRVAQMEARLNTSAKATKEVVLHLYEYEKVFRNISEEKIHLENELQEVVHQGSTLKVENSFLRDQTANLRHDLQALLQVLHQARSTGQWLLDCVTFCELTPDEVFGPVCSYSQGAQAEDSSVFSHSGRSSSCNSSYSNLVEAEQVLARKPADHLLDPSVGLKELQHQVRNLQRLREQAQLELMERDHTVAHLETQITSLNYQVDILRTECDRNRLTVGADGILQRTRRSSSLLLALPTSLENSTGSLLPSHLNKLFDLIDASSQTEEYREESMQESTAIDISQERRNWEDKVQAKEMLISQLQQHLQTSFTEVELKDTALHNAEQKLTASRLDCAQLREDKAQLQQELEEAQALAQNLTENVRLREEELTEQKELRQAWQEQKQNLMIMADEQGENLFQAEEDLKLVKAQNKVHEAELLLQRTTIQNLQEAVIRISRTSIPSQQHSSSGQMEASRRALSQNSVYDI